MAINDDAINDALNTPTNELENEQQDEFEVEESEEFESAEEHEEPQEQEDESESPDLLDSLLGKEKPKRGEGRVQRLANDRRDAEERAERAEREAADLRARVQQQENDAAARARQARQAELDEMDPTERRLLLAEQEARQARFDAADSRDRQAFDSLVARNPHLAKLADDVEKEVAVARRAGQNPSREAVAKYILGSRAFEQLQNAPKLKKQAKQRVDNARGRPMGAQSDARRQSTPDKGDTSEARERRLMGVRL